MIRSPLHVMQRRAGATSLPYGPTQTDDAVEIVDSFGAYEAEYAAIRKGVALLDQPQRGTVLAKGNDRLSFLQAMVTNDTSADKLSRHGSDGGNAAAADNTTQVDGGQACRAFLLSRSGRILVDAIVCRFDDGQVLLVTDRADVVPFIGHLEKYVFTEEVQLEDATGQWHQISLHGPEAFALLRQVDVTASPTVDPWSCHVRDILGVRCRLFRRDEAGVPGLHLMVPASSIQSIYEHLAELLGGLVPEVEAGQKRSITGRAIGWSAYNTARIEAGTTLYHVDFGPDNLPHESGALAEAVSFTKGCYVGQEIVARMENLGHAKRVLVGLRLEGHELPVAGAEVVDMEDSTVIGAITSSTISPMLGHTAIAFAMVKWGTNRPGSQVRVPADGRLVPAHTHDLKFV